MQPSKPEWAKGIDVSNNNGTIDWAKVASSGVTFAFCKATEGATFHDPNFAANYAGMKAAGILRGAYCFARPATSSAEDEADAYVTGVLAAGGFELPPMLDLEDAGGLSKGNLSDFVHAWMNRVKAKTGLQGILYVSRSFANDNLDNSCGLYPLFVAEYGVSQPGTYNTWSKWTFWQYTSSGSVPGINGNVDLDWYAGTVDDLKALCGAEPQSKPAKVQTKGSEDVQTPLLKQGVTGHKSAVKAAQGATGAKVDGIFGPLTAAAVKKFQQAHGLEADQIVGPQTWGKILA